MVMFVFVLGFAVLAALASALGLVVDSRDGADWTPSDGGRRVSRRLGI
jgi:hypothetical protein